jgi:hypothetical protein
MPANMTLTQPSKYAIRIFLCTISFFLFLNSVICQNTDSVKAKTFLDERGEVYFRFEKGKINLSDITRLISIDKIINDTVYAYANSKEFSDFLNYRKSFEVLTPPSLINSIKTNELDGISKAWDEYPSYSEYLNLMSGFADNYPELCLLDTIGQSIEGRLLLAVKISDNVTQKEAEPEFMFSSSMHGDEVTAYVLMLRLIDHLLTNYNTDSEIKQLVDSIEIWINPNANPDGTYSMSNSSVSGATRYNANNIDLNRNFPDPQDGPYPNGDARQPETQVMMDFLLAHNFSLSANYHGGAEVLNYPWDTWSRAHPDEQWFVHISNQYADSVKKYGGNDYFSSIVSSGVINGYDWYPVAGGRQDYATYFAYGREITIELSDVKMPPAADLPIYWDYNRSAMLNYIRQCNFGIHGRLTDSINGLPLKVKIEVIGHDLDNSFIFSEPVNGDFHRLIEPGNYTLRFSKEGYYTKTVDVYAPDAYTEKTYLNVKLVPNTDYINQNIGQIDSYWSRDEHYIILNLPENSSIQTWIVDMQGRTVFNSGKILNVIGEQRIQLNDQMPGGIYICYTLVNDRKLASLKFNY